jgi:hypothetical protein
MRLKFTSESLTPDEKFICQQVEKRQLVAMDLNAVEAEKHLKDLPWCDVIITPTQWFFRQ